MKLGGRKRRVESEKGAMEKMFEKHWSSLRPLVLLTPFNAISNAISIAHFYYKMLCLF